jgi:hypothetical protein
MGRECNTNGEKRNAYMTLVGKPEEKSELGKPRYMLVESTKMGI